MNPEERSLLENVYKMTQENNEILKTLRRSARVSMIVKAVYWLVIIGLSVGALYFIQPYVDFLTGALGGDKTSDSVLNVNNAKSVFSDFQDVLK